LTSRLQSRMMRRMGLRKILHLVLAIAGASASVAAFANPVIREREHCAFALQNRQFKSPPLIHNVDSTKHHSTRLSMSSLSSTDGYGSVLSLLLRGGASEGAVSMLTVENLILALVFVAIGNGVPMAVAPHLSSSIYDLDTSRGTLDNWIVGCLGCFALTIGIATFHATALGGLYTPEVAIAFANLPFLLYVLNCVMTGEFGNAGMGSIPTVVNSVIAMIFTLAILVGGFGKVLNPNLAARLLSIMFIPQGFFAYVNPVGAAKLLVKKDLSEQKKSKALFVGYGALRCVSSIICAAMAFGIQPMKAVGQGSLIRIYAL